MYTHMYKKCKKKNNNNLTLKLHNMTINVNIFLSNPRKFSKP